MSAWNGKDQQKLRYAAEYNLTREFNNMNTNEKSTQINSQSPHTIKDLLWQALQNREHERTSMAKCTSDQTTWWQIERWHRTQTKSLENGKAFGTSWIQSTKASDNTLAKFKYKFLYYHHPRTYQQTKLKTQVSNTNHISRGWSKK